MVMPQFKKTFGLPEDKKATADIVSNVVSTLQAGCFLGALIAFYIADKWGRRPSLLRAASMLTPLYVSENAPRSIRGGLTGIYQLNVTI